jgi:hypothetical protein
MDITVRMTHRVTFRYTSLTGSLPRRRTPFDGKLRELLLFRALPLEYIGQCVPL